MADHSVEIARIESMLASGAGYIMVDGVSVQVNHDTLRKELRRLKNDDDASQARRRPFCQGQYLGGF